MIPPEHAALADAVRAEGDDLTFDESVVIAARLLRHLRRAGYVLRKPVPTIPPIRKGKES